MLEAINVLRAQLQEAGGEPGKPNEKGDHGDQTGQKENSSRHFNDWGNVAVFPSSFHIFPLYTVFEPQPALWFYSSYPSSLLAKYLWEAKPNL